MNEISLEGLAEECSTRDVARALGLAVRSVQLMVDRGELQAWKTPGGHRRIERDSVLRWLRQRREQPAGASVPPEHPQPTPSPAPDPAPDPAVVPRRPRVLLIEDSTHFQNLVRLLMEHHFPQVELHVAGDGIVGLAMAGELRPDVLLVDLLLPGIDGATLVARLHSHPLFQCSRLIVVTSLDEQQRSAYAFALAGLPVVHKPRLVQELPALLAQMLHV
ncbi:response regulator [Alicycliphilus denitrificans]|uniref:response regulator n=1 Tax=Alicycliphilus denitrificans TaxID=179636 RepID=UPI0038511928